MYSELFVVHYLIAMFESVSTREHALHKINDYFLLLS